VVIVNRYLLSIENKQLMKLSTRTPDSISKKRQELRRQIALWQDRIEAIKLSLSITSEEKAEKLKQAYTELKALNASMNETFVGRHRSINFSKTRKLYPGVW
jgi:hypothetical protein